MCTKGFQVNISQKVRSTAAPIINPIIAKANHCKNPAPYLRDKKKTKTQHLFIRIKKNRIKSLVNVRKKKSMQLCSKEPRIR